jgi:hypothetical protein
MTAKGPGDRRAGAALLASLGSLLVAGLLCGSAAAQSADPDPTPILRIETGMHSAPIRRIGVDAQCRLLATGSHDKTVRLWSMPEGKLLRTQRLPIGPGHEGKVFAVSVSPDGRWILRAPATSRPNQFDALSRVTNHLTQWIRDGG